MKTEIIKEIVSILEKVESEKTLKEMLALIKLQYNNYKLNR